MAISSPKLDKSSKSCSRYVYLCAFLRYFLRIWRKDKLSVSRFTSVMHNINRVAIVVFLVGLFFFVVRRLFFE